MTIVGDVLGRREPRRARSDLVCGITSAELTLQTACGMRFRSAAVAFEPPGSSLMNAVDNLLEFVGDDSGASSTRTTDGYGCEWITFSNGPLDDIAIAIGMVAQRFDAVGCWEHLLCATFAFGAGEDQRSRSRYLVFNFARSRFYAFVPRGHGHRDVAEERCHHDALACDLRLETDPQRRYPLWDIPEPARNGGVAPDFCLSPSLG